MKRLFLIGALAWLPLLLGAQPAPPSNLQGAELRTWLKTNWYTGKHKQLGYDKAREAMYGYIDVAPDNRVYCIYSGFSQPSRTTTYLNPINAEHTVPQSFFDQDEPMRSDVHHLFPTHEDVNSSRGNLDFGDVPDDQTSKWFIGGRIEDGGELTTTTTKPASNIDAYSELRNSTKFEVKEDHKGNTARAIFYFYTMYPTQAGAITTLVSIEEMYQWHIDDPVDDAERTRNTRAGERQGNRNPYIDHPDIVARAWGITVTGTEDWARAGIRLYPNPASDWLHLEHERAGEGRLALMSLAGQQVLQTAWQGNSTSVPLGNLPKGLYVLQLWIGEEAFLSRKIVVE